MDLLRLISLMEQIQQTLTEQQVPTYALKKKVGKTSARLQKRMKKARATLRKMGGIKFATKPKKRPGFQSRAFRQ